MLETRTISESMASTAKASPLSVMTKYCPVIGAWVGERLITIRLFARRIAAFTILLVEDGCAHKQAVSSRTQRPRVIWRMPLLDTSRLKRSGRFGGRQPGAGGRRLKPDCRKQAMALIENWPTSVNTDAFVNWDGLFFNVQFEIGVRKLPLAASTKEIGLRFASAGCCCFILRAKTI